MKTPKEDPKVSIANFGDVIPIALGGKREIHKFTDGSGEMHFFPEVNHVVINKDPTKEGQAHSYAAEAIRRGRVVEIGQPMPEPTYHPIGQPVSVDPSRPKPRPANWPVPRPWAALDIIRKEHPNESYKGDPSRINYDLRPGRSEKKVIDTSGATPIPQPPQPLSIFGMLHDAVEHVLKGNGNRSPGARLNLVNAPTAIIINDNSFSIFGGKTRTGKDLPSNLAVLAALPQQANAVALTLQAQNHEGRVAMATDHMIKSGAIAAMSQAAAMEAVSRNLGNAAGLLADKFKVKVEGSKGKTTAFHPPRRGLLGWLLGDETPPVQSVKTLETLAFNGIHPNAKVSLIMPDFYPKAEVTHIKSAAVAVNTFNPVDRKHPQADFRGVAQGDTAMFEGRGTGGGVAASQHDIIGYIGFESNGGGIDTSTGSFEVGIDWSE